MPVRCNQCHYVQMLPSHLPGLCLPSLFVEIFHNFIQISEFIFKVYFCVCWQQRICTKLAIFANISTFYHKQIVYICQLDPIQFQTHSRLITGRLHLIGLKSPWRPQLTVSSCRLVLQRNHFRGNETETATFLHIAAIILVLPKSATIVFP